MFNFGSYSEILIILIAALILIGPKELPQILHTCGRWFYRLKNLTAKVRCTLDQALESGQLAEMEDQARNKALQKMPQAQDHDLVPDTLKSEQRPSSKIKNQNHVS